MKLTYRQRLMATTLMIGAASLATPAWAQAQDETPEPPATSVADPDAGSQDPGAEGISGEGEEIVITGSRIARRDLTSTSPLQVIQDEEFQLSGTANAEQVLATWLTTPFKGAEHARRVAMIAELEAGGSLLDH